MHTKEFDLGRFSDPSLLILASLASGPKHGYAMMEDIVQFCGTQLEPGTLYAALARLERRGWIEALEAEDHRRPYRITGAGEVALREQFKTLQQVVSTGQQRDHSISGAGYAAFSPSVSISASPMPEYHLQKVCCKSSFNTWTRTCNKQCAPSFVHRICCFFTKRLLITSFTVDSTKAVEIVSPLR